MAKKPRTLHGWYSPTAAVDFGTLIYRSPDGEEVEVTAVSNHEDRSGYEGGLYESDVDYLGPVNKWVRRGQEGRRRFYGKHLTDYYVFDPEEKNARPN